MTGSARLQAAAPLRALAGLMSQLAQGKPESTTVELQDLRVAATLLICRAAVHQALGSSLAGLRLFADELVADLGPGVAAWLALAEDLDVRPPALADDGDDGPRRLGELYQLLMSGHVRRPQGGELHVVPARGGSVDARRMGGVHYTPQALVDEVVGPALGALFEAAWRRHAGDPAAARAAIADLRILDPAMGGGHFLLGAAQELARELAWFDIMGARRPAVLYERLEQPDPEFGLRAPHLRRLRHRMAALLPDVIARSCHGVDVDPLAAAMGEAALFGLAASAAADVQQAIEPGFSRRLRLHIRCGDALVGLERASATVALRRGLGLSEAVIARALDAVPSGESGPPRWPLDLAVLVGVLGVRPGTPAELDLWRRLSNDTSPDWAVLFEPSPTRLARSLALREAVTEVARHAPLAAGRPLRPLHPTLAFAEVLCGPRGGFDAVVANPPFIGDRDLGARIGPPLVRWLRRRYSGRGERPGGTPDLAGFFVLRYADLLASTRAVAATLAPNTLAQGRSRKTTLVPLIRDEGAFQIFRAVPDRPWPGAASVRICVLHLARPDLGPPPRLVLGGKLAAPALISTYLDHGPEVAAEQLAPATNAPRRLPSARVPLFYQGMILRGAQGRSGDFVQSLALAAACPSAERGALRAYLNNETVQHQPLPDARRLCIDFYAVLAEAGLLDVSPAAQLDWLQRHYPTTLAAIDDVRRTRQALPDRPSNAAHRRRWWLFGSTRQALRAAWQGDEPVLAVGAVGKIWAPLRLNRLDRHSGLPILPMHKLFLAPAASMAVQACLSSFLFEQHARRQCSTLGTGLNFAPTAALPGWPWPWPSTWDVSRGGPTWRVEDEAISAPLAAAMANLHAVRQPLFLARGGPTALYNLVDDPKIHEPAIVALRRGHVGLLDAHMRAWGWHKLADEMAAEAHRGWTFDRPWMDATWRHVPALTWRVRLRKRLLQANEQRYWQELDLYRPAVDRLAASGDRLAASGIRVPQADLTALQTHADRERWWPRTP